MRPGDPMVVLRGSGDRTPRARVRLIEPSGFTKVSALGIEEQRVNVIGDFLDRPGALGDGYRLDVKIVTWQAPAVTRIPLAALYRCATAWCTFVVERGHAHRVEVTVGHRGDDRAEVRGVDPGRHVILHPSDRIDEGTPIRE